MFLRYPRMPSRDGGPRSDFFWLDFRNRDAATRGPNRGSNSSFQTEVRMVGTHGGKRPGAGRKRKVAAPKADAPQTATCFYADAEAYLVAVVEGREQAEPARIMA